MGGVSYTYSWWQGWQVVAKSDFNHWFLPVKTGWQKRWVAKSGKKIKSSLSSKTFLLLFKTKPDM